MELVARRNKTPPQPLPPGVRGFNTASAHMDRILANSEMACFRRQPTRQVSPSSLWGGVGERSSIRGSICI
jgi:hypothetical protein